VFKIPAARVREFEVMFCQEARNTHRLEVNYMSAARILLVLLASAWTFDQVHAQEFSFQGTSRNRQPQMGTTQSSQDSLYKISGVVSLADKPTGPLPKILVVVTADHGNYHHSANGPKFTFQVPMHYLADLTLTASADNYHTERIRGFSGTGANLNIELKPRMASLVLAPGDPKNTAGMDSTGIPEKAVKEFERAIKEEKQRNVEKALDHLQKALDIYPRFFYAYNEMAAIYLNQGSYKVAEEACIKSISVNPNHAIAQKALGYILLISDREDEAIVPLTKAASLDPSDAWAAACLGEALYQVNKYEEAEKLLKRALELDPANLAAAHRLGYVYLKTKRNKEALEIFRTMLSLDFHGTVNP
jgi:Flp pilus assembly protein TadD